MVHVGAPLLLKVAAVVVVAAAAAAVAAVLWSCKVGRETNIAQTSNCKWAWCLQLKFRIKNSLTRPAKIRQHWLVPPHLLNVVAVGVGVTAGVVVAAGVGVVARRHDCSLLLSLLSALMVRWLRSEATSVTKTQTLKKKPCPILLPLDSPPPPPPPPPPSPFLLLHHLLILFFLDSSSVRWYNESCPIAICPNLVSQVERKTVRKKTVLLLAHIHKNWNLYHSQQKTERMRIWCGQ